MDRALNFSVFPGLYGVCRLEVNAVIPNWIETDDFYAITRTAEELSIICSQHCIPETILCERDWKVLKIEGQLDFALIGILAEVTAILAKKKISVFAVSTYNTDYILVKTNVLGNAINALEESGHYVNK